MAWRDKFMEGYERVSLEEIMEIYQSRKPESYRILKRLEALDQWFNTFVGGWAGSMRLGKEFAKSEKQNKKSLFRKKKQIENVEGNKIADWISNYMKEVRFIFSQGLLNEREIGIYLQEEKPNMFKVIGPLLTLQHYHDIPIEGLLNPALSSGDLDMLYFNLDERIKGLERLMADADILNEGTNINRERIYSRWANLVKKRSYVRDYIEKRD